ncbi:MAG: hypothetical protein K9K38_13065 [Rhodoferax sp.]|nr:hypothetical protein [Rhodoferax sp.]
MTALISPLSKVAALTLSLGLTWSTLGSVATGFAASHHPATQAQTHFVQLPLVLVVGQREATEQSVATAAKLSPQTTVRNPSVL